MQSAARWSDPPGGFDLPRRWLRLVQRGWVWVPGTEWAPAWVAWRWSATHIGWAPLPPEAVNANGFNP